MYVVSFLFLAVQVAVPSAYAGNEDGRLYLWIALVVGVLALGAALMLARAVIASDTGTAEMRAISDAIREGAEAFLRRQYTTIGEIAAALAIVVFVGYHMSSRTSPYALKTVISFLVGAVCSGLAGYTGMYCSIRASIRRRCRTNWSGSGLALRWWRCLHSLAVESIRRLRTWART